MNLLEVARDLLKLSNEQTIYAVAPWTPTSEAAVAVEPQDNLVPQQISSQGFSYFLEVFIARDLVADLSSSGAPATPERICERLIKYAETDA